MYVNVNFIHIYYLLVLKMIFIIKYIHCLNVQKYQHLFHVSNLVFVPVPHSNLRQTKTLCAYRSTNSRCDALLCSCLLFLLTLLFFLVTIKPHSSFSFDFFSWKHLFFSPSGACKELPLVITLISPSPCGSSSLLVQCSAVVNQRPSVFL